MDSWYRIQCGISLILLLTLTMLGCQNQSASSSNSTASNSSTHSAMVSMTTIPSTTKATLSESDFVGLWSIAEIKDTIWEFKPQGKLIMLYALDATDGDTWKIQDNKLIFDFKTTQFDFGTEGVVTKNPDGSAWFWTSNKNKVLTFHKEKDSSKLEKIQNDIGNEMEKNLKAEQENQSMHDNVSGGNRRWVSAPSGLKLRMEPRTNAQVIVSLTYGQEVMEMPITNPVPFEVEGKKGYWANVVSGHMSGFAFSGFLSSTPIKSGNSPTGMSDSYCFRRTTDTTEETVRLSIKDTTVQGSLEGVVEDKENNYNTSYTIDISGQKDGNTLSLNLTVHIEEDVQQSAEQWSLSANSLVTPNGRYDAVECGKAN